MFYYFKRKKEKKMDSITLKLFENNTNLPFDIVRYINEFVAYKKLTDDNIDQAIELWETNKKS